MVNGGFRQKVFYIWLLAFPLFLSFSDYEKELTETMKLWKKKVMKLYEKNSSEAVHCSSFEELLEKVKSSKFADKIETAWIIGGSKVYEGAIELNLCDRFYLTEIFQEFECDTFLDVDLEKKFRESWDDRVPEGVQEENGIKYKFYVYEKLP